MSKKIAIVTLYGNLNFGNRLQNYAALKWLSDRGNKVITIVRGPRLKTNSIKKFIKYLALLILPTFTREHYPDIIRENNFKKFSQAYIPTRIIKSRRSTIPPKIVNEFDFFIVGSDQVWNPCFGDFDNLFNYTFLTNVPRTKKMCLSPSFGVTKIPFDWQKRFSDALVDFPNLCAREQSGVDIIRELTGREAELLIDPTLLLDKSEWLKIARAVPSTNIPYTLDYFLGETPVNNTNYISAVNGDCSNQRICLLDRTNPEIYGCGPAEFIYLIYKASLICTDSFHACVFAIIFSKPFIVFKRTDTNEDMYSRIETLLELFDIHGDCSLEKPYSVDEQVRDKILDAERMRAFSFIKKSISIGDR